MLILLRHGRTPANEQRRLQGSHDPSLDEVGRIQAEQAGHYIRSRWQIDEVVTSSLARTRQTAASAGFGDSAVVDDRWREIDFGGYDRRPIKEVVQELAAAWNDDIHFEPADGESMAMLHDRVVSACVELEARAQDRNILVVSHATPIKSAAVWAMGGSPSQILNLSLNIGTVSVIGHYHGALVLKEFNSWIPRPA